MKTIVTSLLGAALLGSGVAAAPAIAADQQAKAVYGQPATIPFAANGGIRDWHAANDRQLYIRDRAGRWYLATLSAPCHGLTFNNAVAFETDELGQFDTWSRVVTRDHRCGVESLVRSPAPAAKGGPRLVR